MSFQKKMLSFFLVTSIGYSITSIATFLSIETVFHSIRYLGMTLSLRTLFSCLLGYKANHLIQKINIKNLFILSQVFGLISVISIYLGFYFHTFSIVFFGIILIGLPTTLTTILLSITLRLSSECSIMFRKYSGSRELVFGASRLLACLAAPLILLKANISYIIFFNLVTYSIGLMFFVSLDLKRFINEKIADSVIKINALILKSKDTWRFACQTLASISLIALVPLLASSDNISLTQDLSPLLRQSLWSVEALTMIFGSVIYLVAKKLRELESVKVILMLNSVFLFLFLYFKQPYMVVGIVMLISVLMMLSFYIFRDDYVISAGENIRLIEAHSAFSAIMKDLICSVSPVMLSYVFTKFTMDIAIWMLLTIQFILLIGYLFLSKDNIDAVLIKDHLS